MANEQKVKDVTDLYRLWVAQPRIDKLFFNYLRAARLLNNQELRLLYRLNSL